MKTADQRFTEVCQLDTCLSDYFTGYHMPVIAIPVYNGITNHDIANDIQGEINASWEYLCNEEHGFTEEEMKLFDTFCTELKSKPEEIIIKGLEEIDEENDL